MGPLGFLGFLTLTATTLNTAAPPPSSSSDEPAALLLNTFLAPFIASGYGQGPSKSKKKRKNKINVCVVCSNVAVADITRVQKTTTLEAASTKALC
jgi:hypothetical protein